MTSRSRSLPCVGVTTPESLAGASWGYPVHFPDVKMEAAGVSICGPGEETL